MNVPILFIVVFMIIALVSVISTLRRLPKMGARVAELEVARRVRDQR